MPRYKLVCFFNRKKNNVKEFIFDNFEDADAYRNYIKNLDKKFIQEWSYIATIYY